MGSVKTSIGHLEAGAGVAGLIKTALCCEHRSIPPNLHFNQPNPRIPFDDMCIKVVDKITSWESDKIRMASINSFGYGGTNAHAVLEEYKAKSQQVPDAEVHYPVLLPISTRNDIALKQLAEKYADCIAQVNNSSQLNDSTYSAMCCRNHLSHRLAITAVSQQDFVEKLRTFA